MNQRIKKISIVLFILLSFSKVAAISKQDSTSVSVVMKKTIAIKTVADSVSIHFKTKVLSLTSTVQPFLADKFGLALKQTFKYDTTWNNPENRCYEYKKSITSKYLFLFKFTSKQQYEPSTLP